MIGYGFFSSTFNSVGRALDSNISCHKLGSHELIIFIFPHKPIPECIIEQKAPQTDVLKNH